MSTHDELITTIQRIRDRTGDPNAWQAGLAPDEVAAAITPVTPPGRLDAIVRKIRQQHPDVFGAVTPGGAPSGQPEQGEAAEAMAGAEAALAHQNSASSRLDMQVITAILNAHLKAVEGQEALTSLQREIETAVLTRSDLDTPAGARDFQRFLIGKLKDIRTVVLNASLDDTSKSALMAAWTSLYDASKAPEDGRDDHAPATDAAPPDDPDQQWVDDPEADPLPDSTFADDPGLPVSDAPGPAPAAGATAPPPPASGPPIPSLGGASMPGLGGPGGLPLPDLAERTDPGLRDVDDEGLPGPHEPDYDDQPDGQNGDDDKARDEDAAADEPAAPPPGPTTVTLPDGDTVTAASPQLAAVIKAAVGGATIADAFHQQGITVPAPGTAVTNTVDPPQALPGDIGIFTDRHALALGHEKALLDGQIQRIATVSGPSFLGWEHPPAATAPAIPPAKPHAPTPTGPAGTSTTT